MNWQQFEFRFPTELGRELHDPREESHIYATNDNGDVGVWIINNRTTEGDGRQLFGEQAAAALHRYRQPKPWMERVQERTGWVR